MALLWYFNNCFHLLPVFLRHQPCQTLHNCCHGTRFAFPETCHSNQQNLKTDQKLSEIGVNSLESSPCQNKTHKKANMFELESNATPCAGHFKSQSMSNTSLLGSGHSYSRNMSFKSANSQNGPKINSNWSKFLRIEPLLVEKAKGSLYVCG